MSNLTLQAGDPSRATLVDVARTGGKALKLTTQTGDTNVAFSGLLRRCDVYASIPGTADPVLYGEGATMWVNHSVMFPDDFQAPRWHPYTVFDFHDLSNVSAAGGGNFHLNFQKVGEAAHVDDFATAPGVLRLQWYAGDPLAPTERHVLLDWITRNVWYDFVHHVRWSSTNHGFWHSWVNGVRVASYVGPTMFAGDPVYLKLANYHLPVSDAEIAAFGWSATPASSVIHDLVSLTVTS